MDKATKSLNATKHRLQKRMLGKYSKKLTAYRKALELLCYRFHALTVESPDHTWASNHAVQLVRRAERGTLDNEWDFLPPNIRLLYLLYCAYYAVPGRVSMATVKPLQPLPEQVEQDAVKASKLVDTYWKQVPSFAQWMQSCKSDKPARSRRKVWSNHLPVEDGVYWTLQPMSRIPVTIERVMNLFYLSGELILAEDLRGCLWAQCVSPRP